MLNKIKSVICRYNAVPVQVKASIWFAICSILQRGLSVVTVPLFTRLMTVEQYGYYTTYISWYNVLIVFTSLNLFEGVFNNAMIKYQNDRAGYISSMQGLVFSITSFVFLGYLIFQDTVNLILGMTTPLVLMLFLELLVTPCLHFWMAVNRFEYKYKPIVIVTLIKSVLNPVLGLIFVVNSDHKDIARITSIVTVEFTICSIVAFSQFLKGKKFFQKDYWKYAFVFNIALLPHYLSGQILNQSDRIMISKMVGNSSVAIYSVAYNIGLLLNIFTNAINGSYTPWFYQTLKRKNYSQIRHVTLILVALMGLLVVILMFFAPEIIAILGSAEYKDGVFCIPPVAASAFFLFLYVIYADVEFYFEKRSYVLFGSIMSAGLNLILNYIFILQYGYIAAAYTTLVSYIAFCIFHNMSAIKICKNQKIPISIFSSKNIVVISLIVILISLSMNLFYRSSVLRYSIICCIVAIVIIKRKVAIGILKDTLKTIKMNESV